MQFTVIAGDCIHLLLSSNNSKQSPLFSFLFFFWKLKNVFIYIDVQYIHQHSSVIKLRRKIWFGLLIYNWKCFIKRYRSLLIFCYIDRPAIFAFFSFCQWYFHYKVLIKIEEIDCFFYTNGLDGQWENAEWS